MDIIGSKETLVPDIHASSARKASISLQVLDLSLDFDASGARNTSITIVLLQAIILLVRLEN